MFARKVESQLQVIDQQVGNLDSNRIVLLLGSGISRYTDFVVTVERRI